jgi:hypothetical protein
MKPYFLLSCLIAGMVGMSQGQTTKPTYPHTDTWYITGCPADGTRLTGKDRLDADVHSGVTIWSESEWADARKNLGWKDGCVGPLDKCTDDVIVSGSQPAPKPAPIDVPAIKGADHFIEPMSGDAGYMKGFLEECTKFGMTVKDNRCSHSTVTCSDKSRILMRSEDGKAWCHKVQPQ